MAAEGDESSLLDATGDFLESFGAANSGEIFFEKVVSGREYGFFFTGPFSFAGFGLGFFAADDGRAHRIG